MFSLEKTKKSEFRKKLNNEEDDVDEEFAIKNPKIKLTLLLLPSC